MSSKTFGVETQTLSMYGVFFSIMYVTIWGLKVDHMNNQLVWKQLLNQICQKS